jgi:8-oxo-dGTP pyrophosphatase MutT (NUDIX family)
VRFVDAVARLEPLPDVLPPASEALTTIVRTDSQWVRPDLPPAGRTTRPAAVLVLVFPDETGAARLVLIERTTHDGHHSGEVSFPGGKAEPGDADEAATALREAAEEVALDAADAGVRVVGTLEPFWIPVSDFQVTPIVALAERPPVLRPEPREVAAILRPSVGAFLPDAPVDVVERTIRDWPLRFGSYTVEGRTVWGATARVLSQLGNVLAG